MKPSQQLELAKSRISDPAKWTQHSMAKLHGERRCAVGAFLSPECIAELEKGFYNLKHVELGIVSAQAIKYLSDMIPERVYSASLDPDPIVARIIDYNDGSNRKHVQVMEWFDRAIAKATWDELVKAEAEAGQVTEEVANEVAVTTGS